MEAEKDETFWKELARELEEGMKRDLRGDSNKEVGGSYASSRDDAFDSFYQKAVVNQFMEGIERREDPFGKTENDPYRASY